MQIALDNAKLQADTALAEADELERVAQEKLEELEALEQGIALTEAQLADINASLENWRSTQNTAAMLASSLDSEIARIQGEIDAQNAARQAAEEAARRAEEEAQATTPTEPSETDATESSDPTESTDPTESSTIYNGPILVDDDTEIRVRAWKRGMNPSAVVAEIYTYASSQGVPKGDYFADPIKIAGASGSRVIDDNSAYTVEDDEPQHTDSWYDEESGYYYSNYELKTVWYKWMAPGSGTMTFSTMASGGGHVYPTLIAIYTGDALASIQRVAVSTTHDSNWITSLSLPVEQGITYRIVGMMGCNGSGTFTLSWSGDLTVMPTETSTTEVPVTYAWLDEYFPGSTTGDYEGLANSDRDGDGLDTWAEYLLGTDPTNALSRLEATIRMDGTTPIVECNADTNRLAAFGYLPVVKGKQGLDTSEEWATTNLLHRFFKIFVEKNQ